MARAEQVVGSRIWRWLANKNPLVFGRGGSGDLWARRADRGVAFAFAMGD